MNRNRPAGAVHIGESDMAKGRLGKLPRLTLVLGGGASGKSHYAENLVMATGLSRVYVATARASDAEMQERILRHRRRRGANWTTEEVLEDLAGFLSGGGADAEGQLDQPQEPALATGTAVLVDCLTLWLSGLLASETDDMRLHAARADLLSALAAHRGPLVCVSDDVSGGLVPGTPLGRRFRDEQGRMNQDVAALADLVIFVTAGLPQVLKGRLPDRGEFA